MRRLTITYWTAGEPVVNLGDYLTHALLEKLGYQVRLFDPQTDQGPVLLGIGTMFSDDWLRRRTRGRRKMIWGSGWGGAPLTLPLEDVDVLAVRGPVTRDHLQLPADLPLGDPALLMPRFFPLTRGGGPVTFIPHIQQERAAGPDAIRDHARSIGAQRVRSMAVKPAHFAERLAEIVESSFIITGSLHGAILAQAYGIPWAPHLMPGEKLNLPRKWDDWAAYLGISLEGQSLSIWKWWDCIGRHGKLRDLDPLLSALLQIDAANPAWTSTKPFRS